MNCHSERSEESPHFVRRVKAYSLSEESEIHANRMGLSALERPILFAIVFALIVLPQHVPGAQIPAVPAQALRQ
jgi:hypothetical protein